MPHNTVFELKASTTNKSPLVSAGAVKALHLYHWAPASSLAREVGVEL